MAKKTDTRLMHAARPTGRSGFVNLPSWRGSTVVFDTLATFDEMQAERLTNVVYGRLGTPTTKALAEALSEIETQPGVRNVIVGSGLAANTVALVSCLEAGDHVLIVDTVYSPVRSFADRHLAAFGVDVEYFDPAAGAGIADLVRPETRALFCETPGSQTFEMLDLPAVSAASRAAATHRKGLVVIADNTWATPYFFDALGHGADIATIACTKYILGHSDGMLGAIATRDEARYKAAGLTANAYGHSAGSEETWLALRGIRTLPVRMRQHQDNARAVAGWLAEEARVARVMYPGHPSDPGHALWRRDFTGASGLLGIVLDKDYPVSAIAAFIDGLELFSLGASWGGYESLILHFDPHQYRTATSWRETSPTLRLHVGLEDPVDLIDDLDAAFRRLEGTA